MKARLYLDVEFDGRKTDTESIASALDKVMKSGLATLWDCWDEYGDEPKVGQFLVLDAEPAPPLANDPGGKDDTDEVEMRWHNFYRCPDCGEEWEDCWDSQCDDECPHCGCRNVSPHKSEEIEKE